MYSMKCPNCKTTDHEEGARFCHICGTKLLSNNDAMAISPKRLHAAFPFDIMNKSENEIAIDLGLLSGTRWASHNIGALKPQGTGDYFAWGEIETKEKYTWKTYLHCENGEKNSCRNMGVGSKIPGSKYDVAHMNWGMFWMMPTRNQFLELIDNCTYEWTNAGGRFVSKINGNSIFLPSAGSFKDTECSGNIGFYWSCEFDADNICNAFALTFDDQAASIGQYYRKNGFVVRPVISSFFFK